MFGADEGCDGAARGGRCVETEGAAAKTTPLLVPINHRVCVGCVAASAATEVDQIVKIGQGFCQGNAAPS